MTAAQTKARANFKKAIAYRKKTGVSLKEAFASVYGKKKVGAVKKKVAPKNIITTKKRLPSVIKLINKTIDKVYKKKVAKKVVRKVVKKKAAPIKAENKQYNLKLDKLYEAKKQGKRKSASGNIYYEYRKNRTDKNKFSGIGKITKAQEIKNLSSLGVGPLMKKVITILKSKAKDYSSLKPLYNDVLNNGLQSGIISDLIYYKDTLAFYKKYKSEIVGLLNEAVYSSGLNVEDLFGSKWDRQDPFAQETNNQNLLCWFAFEETTRQLKNIMY